jgi:hypothetical protein
VSEVSFEKLLNEVSFLLLQFLQSFGDNNRIKCFPKPNL